MVKLRRKSHEPARHHSSFIALQPLSPSSPSSPSSPPFLLHSPPASAYLVQDPFPLEDPPSGSVQQAYPSHAAPPILPSSSRPRLEPSPTMDQQPGRQQQHQHQQMQYHPQYLHEQQQQQQPRQPQPQPQQQQQGPFPHGHPQQHRQSSYGLPPSPVGDPRLRGSAGSTGYGSAPLSPVDGPSPTRAYPGSAATTTTASARQSPAPSGHSRDGSSGPTRPTSQLPSAGSSRSLASQAGPAAAAVAGPNGAAPPQTIAGEPLHDLQRAAALLKSSKFYAEGFLMKKVEANPEGKGTTGGDAQWAKWFVQLSGFVMSTWNAADMEAAARDNRTVPPQYLNLQDAFVHPMPPHPRGPKTPTQFQFCLNSAGQNRILFCAPSLQSLSMWINAIRLSFWERSRCNEIWTGSLLGVREPRPLGWQGYDVGLPAPHSAGSSADGGRKASAASGRFEGWLKARLPGDTEWRRVWAVVVRGSSVPSRASVVGGPAAVAPAEEKKSRRTSLLSFGKKDKKVDEIAVEELPGGGAVSTLAFYDRKPSKKEQPLCVAQHIYYAAAIYPDHDALLESSTLFKVEGTFLSSAEGWVATGYGVGGRAEKQGYAYMMLEEGSCVDMLHWIVGIADAFKLYGRPRNFSFDPRDPNSLYFALPIGPHRDRQFLDRELVDNLSINEGRPRAIRATFHNILFDRMRGVRPASLAGPPPPQDGRSAPSSGAGTPTSPVDPNDVPRRWSQQQPQQQQPGSLQQPQLGRSDNSPQLPPILPTIGEGSLVDDRRSLIAEPQALTSDRPSSFAAATPIEPQGVDARRMSLHRQSTADRRMSSYGAIEESPVYQSPSPSQQQTPSPQPIQEERAPAAEEQPQQQAQQQAQSARDYLGTRRPSHGTSAEGDMSTYAAYLSSDIARERTPPPPPTSAPRQQQQQQQQYQHEHEPYQQQQPRGGPTRLVAPIDTAAEARAPSSNGSTPLHQLSTAAAIENGQQQQQTPRSASDRSLKTHLSYAPPAQSTNSHADYEQLSRSPVEQRQQQHLSPLYPPESAPLPSPGAGSSLAMANPPSPGLPYLDASPAASPAAQQHEFQQPQQRPPRQAELFSAPAPPIPLVVRNADESSSAPPRASIDGDATRSDVSAGTRVSQAHNGHVADSPEHVNLESPRDQTFTTQPLFAGSPRPGQVGDSAEQRASESQPHFVDAPVEQARPQGSPRPDLQVDTEQQRRPQHEAGPLSARQQQQKPSYDLPEEYNIHSDLLAALDYVDNPESPTPATPHTMSSVGPSPAMAAHPAFHVGPPKRGMFVRDASPSDEQYGSDGAHGLPPVAEAPKAEAAPALAPPVPQPARVKTPVSSTSPAQQTSFPSSFANNKREERAAAAQLAQQAQQQALARPGRAPGAKPVKKKAWEDSDEEEEEVVDDDTSEDEAPPARVQHSASSGSLAPSPANVSRATSPIGPSASRERHAQARHQYNNSPQRTPGVDPAARQSYLDHGPGYANYPGGSGTMSASPSRPDFGADVHGQQQQQHLVEGQPARKPALNPHGLLATGIIEKEERSARAQESAARDTGGTLVNLPHKAPPPQTGLVGALTSHQREKERTGGVGRALTEQQRERKLAEQRQKQLDDLQKQQLALMQQQMQMAQFGAGGGAGPYGQMGQMGSMQSLGGYGGGSNPWMMGGGGMGVMPSMGMGGGFGAFPQMPGAQSHLGGSPQLQPQQTGDGVNQQQQQQQAFQQQQAMMAAQHAAQQAAQQAAQHAYLAAMSQFQGASSPNGGVSPSLPPTSFASMPSMQFMPTPYGYPTSPSMGGGFGGFVPGHGQQSSMYAPSGFGVMNNMQVPGAGAGGEDGPARAVSPLDLKSAQQQQQRRDGSE